MVNKLEIREIGKSDLKILKSFLENMGTSNSSFRYFQSRPLNVVENHALTLIALKEGTPVGYGHLDLEDSIVWLGIAVGESHKGQGIGKSIMRYLITSAKKMEIPELSLAVDEDNLIAIKLYKKNGFLESSRLENGVLFMKRQSKK